MTDAMQKCRLCLENVGELAIFPDPDIVSSDPTHLAIPMRIAACTTLFMQANDGLPNMICCDCRLELEKSYYFRKRAAVVDSKLRQHARRTNMGQPSALTEIDDELEGLDDSVILITEMEGKRKMELYAQWKTEVERSLMQDLEADRNAWIAEQKDALEKEIEAALRPKLRDEVKLEVRLEIEDSIRASCIEEAKFQLRNEMYESIERELSKKLRQEIRLKERQVLLRDLEGFLSTRQGEFEATKGEGGSTADYITLIAQQPPKANQAEVKTADIETGSESVVEDFDDQQSFISVENDFKIKLAKQDYDNDMLINYQMEYSDAEEDSVFMSGDNQLHYKLETSKSGNDVNSGCIYKLVEDTEGHDSNVVVINLGQDNAKEQSEDVNDLEQSLPGDESNIENSPSTQPSIHPTKSLQCELCPMKFATYSSLKRHVQTHIKCDEKGQTFQCQDCKGYFSCRSSLNRHMLVHSGERPHTCLICHKSFSQLEVLKRHRQTHASAKKFKCHLCERSFAQRVCLTEHINKAHSNNPEQRSFDCHMCTKSFSHASGLSRHFATHGGVSYQCNNCQRAFSDKSSIKRHIVTVHGIQDRKSIEMLQKKILPGINEQNPPVIATKFEEINVDSDELLEKMIET